MSKCTRILVVFLAAMLLFASPGLAAKFPKGTTIHVAMVAEPRADAIKKLLPEFEKETGIKVILDILPYPTLQEKQMIAVTTKTGAFDVVHVDCVWMGQYAGQGWLTPLTPYIEKADPKVLNIKDFMPLILAEQGTWEGTVYGLPFITAVQGLYIRTDIFKKYGLKEPQTWDELYETANFITEKEKNNGIYGLSFMGKRGVQLLCNWVNTLWSFGGEIYDKDYHARLNSDEAVKSLEYFVKLKEVAPPGVISYDWDENTAAFQQGKVAMALQWQNAAPQFVDPSKSLVVGKWKFVPMPGVKQPDGTIKRTPVFGGWGLGITKDSKNKDAAWEFIQWATTQQMEIRLAYSGQGARRSTLTNPNLVKKYIEYQAMVSSLELSKGRPRIPEWTEMADAIEVALSQALTGEKTPSEALGEANQKIALVLMRAGYTK